jgi:hypothetical protein
VAATPAASVPVLDTTAVRLLDVGFPALPDAGPHDPLLRLLVPHALALLRRIDDPPASADALAVATRLAVALHRTGDYVSAWETARAAADIGEMTDVVARREHSLGPDHPFKVARRELLSAFTSGRWRPPGGEA